jgi:hypothetical protein
VKRERPSCRDSDIGVHNDTKDGVVAKHEQKGNSSWHQETKRKSQKPKQAIKRITVGVVTELNQRTITKFSTINVFEAIFVTCLCVMFDM